MSVVGCRTDNIKLIYGTKYQEYFIEYKAESVSFWATSWENAEEQFLLMREEIKEKSCEKYT